MTGLNETSRTWKFTEYDMERRNHYERLDCNVIVFGEELTQKGIPHLQGHITFKRTYRKKALIKLFPGTHWEVAKCEDFNYEMKGEKVFIKDNRKKKGERTDLNVIHEMIKDGATLEEIAEAQPSNYIRYHKGIEKLQQLIQKEHESAEYTLSECCEHLRVDPLEPEYGTCVLQGAPGCGKTQFALAHFKQPLLVTHIDTLLTYNPKYHDGIIFDDMDFKHWHRTHQIHITDWDNTRQIHCRYRVAIIPKHTQKIFVCNEYPFIWDDAINRRVTVTEVSER